MPFELCDFVIFFIFVLFFSFTLLIFFVGFGQINFLEKVEERFNFFLNGFLFVLSFLFNGLDGDILSFFPVDIITKASFDLITFEFELFGKSGVREPFVFTECEDNFKVIFRFLDGLDFGQMFDKGLINLSDLFTDNIVGNEGFEPVFRELFVFVVIMLDFSFIFSEDGVSFEISI